MRLGVFAQIVVTKLTAGRTRRETRLWFILSDVVCSFIQLGSFLWGSLMETGKLSNIIKGVTILNKN